MVLTNFDLLPGFRIRAPGLVVGSFLYGFISWVLGIGNVVKTILFREMNITKESFVGAMAATGAHLWPAAGLITVAVLVAFTGRRLLKHFSEGHFELGLKILLVTAAIGLLV